MLNNHLSNVNHVQNHAPMSNFFAESYYHSPPLTNASPVSSPQMLSHYPNYYPLVPPSPSYFPIQQLNPSPIRFSILLEAQTAATQKIDDLPLTYLNKGQYYNITLKDKENFDGEIKSTIAISFHDENHRTSAADYWKYWLAQQNNATEAKAVELDTFASTGVRVIEEKQFDRISFSWNGKLGASISICFNCLSTDFSRIKGVKGIPLRLQVESVPCDFNQIEKTFCRIKLFRDKGAQRKNKDDAKHIERQLRKLYENRGDAPLHCYQASSPVTLFTEMVSPAEKTNIVQPYSPSLQLPPITSMKRSLSQMYSYPAGQGVEPTFAPPRRRRMAKLSLLVKFHENDVYRAIYLEHLTLKEFSTKITQRMDIKKPIANVFRKKPHNKKYLLVRVDDEVIQDIHEEQDIHIETKEHSDSVDLILNF